MPPSAPPTYADVWHWVSKIPRGRVATYGLISSLCGAGPRFAGYALHNTPLGLDIPWHRVINAAGKISLPGESGRRQRALLEREGIVFTGNRVDLKRYGWKCRSRKMPRRRA